MPNKAPFGKILAIAAAIVAVSAALAVIVDKLMCHLITFYATYHAPRVSEEPDFSQTEEQPFCPDAAR